MRQVQSEITILDAAQATGAGNKILCSDFRHLDLTLAAAGMGVGDTITMKIQGSSALEAPDFDASKTISNEWDYIQCIDQEDGSAVDGDVGITFSASNDLRKVVANVDGLRWITVNITTISDAVNTSGSVKATLYND
jgi:hypothetical protein